jgi:glutaredoxin
MDRRSVSLCTVAGLLALFVSANLAAQDKSLYKYTDADGRVVYSDKPPPPGAKNVQPKRLGENVIETNEVPIAAQIASEKYPVTLYTFKCGELCESAEALLNRRGVPFTTIDVSEQSGASKLQALTGAKDVPVLQVGDKLVSKGLNETRWQAMLDEAGYPKTPPPRRIPPGGSPPRPPADAKTRSEAAPGQAAAPPPPADGGYPKN